MGLSHSRQQTQDTDPCLPFPLLLPNDSILNTLQVFWGMGWFYVCYCNLHSAWHRRTRFLINTGAPRVDVQDFLLWHGDCQTESATCFLTAESPVPAFLIVHLPGQYINEKRPCSLLPVQGLIHKLPFPAPTL